MFRFLSTSVRVIWYEVPASEEPIPLFTRLNQGRIPLTDAELLKAVLLARCGKSTLAADRRSPLSGTGLSVIQRPDVWAFVTARQPRRAASPEHGTRIDLLFETLAKPATGASPSPTTPLTNCALRPRAIHWPSGRVEALRANPGLVPKSRSGTTRSVSW